MGVSYSENIILFRGVLTQEEINQIVKRGSKDIANRYNAFRCPYIAEVK